MAHNFLVENYYEILYADAVQLPAPIVSQYILGFFSRENSRIHNYV